MRLVREHVAAILGAFIFGLLLAGPYVYFAFQSESSPVIYPELANDQDFYLSRIQDVRDGYPTGGNTYLYEYKDATPVQILLGEMVVAGILDALSVDTPTGVVILQIIFPPIIFLLTYAIALALGAPRVWALTATAFLCLGSMFFLFARPISPQFNFIFWLITVWGLIKLADNPNWKWALFQAMSVGSLFYLYPYYWTHIGASYAVLVLIAFVYDKKIALWSIVSGIGGLVVGSGYLSMLLHARELPFYTETLERLGGVYTRFPSGIMFVLSSAVLIVVVLYVARRLGKISPRMIVSLSLLLGGIIAMNQHLITGFTLEFTSHYKMQIQFANIFLALATVSSFGWWGAFERKKYLGVVVGIIGALSVMTITVPYLTAIELSRENSRFASYAPVVEWLKENAQTDEVVYAEEDLAKLIPAYTAQNVFYARNANLFFMPEEEIRDRAVLQNYRAAFDEAFFTDAERELFGQRYMNTHQHAVLQQKILGLFGFSVELPERLPQSSVNDILDRAERFKQISFKDAISPYRVDYFMVRKDDPYRLLESDLIFAERVFETEAYVVYKKTSRI